MVLAEDQTVVTDLTSGHTASALVVGIAGIQRGDHEAIIDQGAEVIHIEFGRKALDADGKGGN